VPFEKLICIADFLLSLSGATREVLSIVREDTDSQQLRVKGICGVCDRIDTFSKSYKFAETLAELTHVFHSGEFKL